LALAAHERGGNNLNGFKDFHTEIGSSHGQNGKGEYGGKRDEKAGKRNGGKVKSARKSGSGKFDRKKKWRQGGEYGGKHKYRGTWLIRNAHLPWTSIGP